MRLVALASDPRALPFLEAFTRPPHALLAVVTQPDRPKGRGRRTEPSEVAAWARARGIPLLQPADVNAPGTAAAIRDLAPEALPVIAFGQKLGRELLDLPRHGCLNFHPSLLPRHRGASPVPAAILAGDERTGACIFRMDERMDAGPLIRCREAGILPDDTAETLGARLFALGPALFLEALDALASGTARLEAQDDRKATKAPKLSKALARLDWTRPAPELARRVLAFRPWPLAWGELDPGDGRPPVRLGILRASAGEGDGTPGLLLDGGRVACGEGSLRLEEVRPEGRSAMPAEAFLRGARLGPAARFLP